MGLKLVKIGTCDEDFQTTRLEGRREGSRRIDQNTGDKNGRLSD